MQTDADGRVAVTATVTAAGHELTVDMRLPAGRTRPAELLPLFRSVSDHLVEAALVGVRAEGRAVSCRKGCGACCSQLVPLAPLEAWHLGALIARLPEPRQGVIRARFAAARQGLGEAGMLAEVRDPVARRLPDVPTFAKRYLAQDIPCPFLEDGACSIYEERPIICREYLVTSSPAYCARPEPGSIRTVPVPGSTTAALRWLGPTPGAAAPDWVPLVLLPEWLAAHPEPEPGRTGVELAEEFFKRLDTGDAAEPTGAR
ncbi:MAG: YkgJ family cysteine cluster protein [Gemmatimonadetes bacterium]|nr:YkgJ family cysteine cluster protein [Gemmatimonadota bacterium]